MLSLKYVVMIMITKYKYAFITDTNRNYRHDIEITDKITKPQY